MIPPERCWLSLASTEVPGLVARDPVVVLPLAACEQHGAHLPLGTDAVIGEGLIAEACRRLEADFPLRVLPTMVVAASDEHLGYPGSLSLPAETVVASIVHQGHALHACGVRRLVLCNSHGGNRAAMDTAALRLRRECGLLVVKAAYTRLPGPQPPVLGPEEARHGLHGGALETALMRHLAPEQVRDGACRRHPSLGQRLEAAGFRWLGPEGAAAFGWLAGDLAPSGVVGDATAAHAGAGAHLTAHYGGLLAEVFREAGRFPLEWLDGG